MYKSVTSFCVTFYCFHEYFKLQCNRSSKTDGNTNGYELTIGMRYDMPLNWNDEAIPSEADKTTDILGFKEIGGIGQLIYHPFRFSPATFLTVTIAFPAFLLFTDFTAAFFAAIFAA